MFIIFIPLRYYLRKIRLFFRRQNTSDAEEEEVHSEKLATPLAQPHYFVKTEAELFWSFFRSRHRGMSGSSIFLNMLLITVRLPIYLNVSIAVSHVPSAAPLSGLPHRQIIIYMSIFLPTVSMCMYFLDGSLTFRNRFEKLFQNSVITDYAISVELFRSSIVLSNSNTVDQCCCPCTSYQPVSASCLQDVPKWYVKIQHKCVSQPPYMAYHRISICNRYGTNALKVFQTCNMAMQTATLPLTESNGKSKGKKFSPRRCLRLRLRENKICILPLGYAKGVIMQILNCLGKFSPRRCLRLRLRENKICILPLGYAK
ncbi:hypothetical protein T09_12014, partial [Trichinella sp. T9]